jgi:hypothetical protein
LGTDCQLNLPIKLRLQGIVDWRGLRFAAHTSNHDENK